jgi:chromosome partitioning protein
MSEKQPRSVAFNVLKGGMGKTMVSKNTACELAREDSVLLIDLDDNGHLSRHLGFEEEFFDGYHIGEAMTERIDVELEDLVHDTGFGFDFIPATHRIEQLEGFFRGCASEVEVLRNQIVEPWLGSRYDYILFDTPANRSLATKNAVVAARNLVVPVVSGVQGDDGISSTIKRIHKPLNERLDAGVRILGLIPNKINQRLDQQTNDRKLLENINTRDGITRWVPNFARIPDEIWTEIDNGALSSTPKPGIRYDGDLDKEAPLRYVNDESQQLEYFEEIANIVRYGGVSRNDDIADEIRKEHGGSSA